ncbi:hypothetical protein LTR28_004614 [Elasticomyces elasticus]|nr:hypothetical protein LTR28_004614 [Elasticomyces elasticus]
MQDRSFAIGGKDVMDSIKQETQSAIDEDKMASPSLVNSDHVDSTKEDKVSLFTVDPKDDSDGDDDDNADIPDYTSIADVGEGPGNAVISNRPESVRERHRAKDGRAAPELQAKCMVACIGQNFRCIDEDMCSRIKGWTKGVESGNEGWKTLIDVQLNFVKYPMMFNAQVWKKIRSLLLQKYYRGDEIVDPQDFAIDLEKAARKAYCEFEDTPDVKTPLKRSAIVDSSSKTTSAKKQKVEQAETTPTKQRAASALFVAADTPSAVEPRTSVSYTGEFMSYKIDIPVRLTKMHRRFSWPGGRDAQGTMLTSDSHRGFFLAQREHLTSQKELKMLAEQTRLAREAETKMKAKHRVSARRLQNAKRQLDDERVGGGVQGK